MLTLRKSNLFRVILILTIAFAAQSIGSAQTVVYDWSSDSKVPESYPTITRRQTVVFRITNVNDILFTYRMEITQQPIAADDFGKLAALFKLFRPGDTTAGAVPTCAGLEDEVKALIQQAIKEVKQDPNLPVGYAARSSHPSVPVRDSINAWNSHKPAINEAIEEIGGFLTQCQPVKPTLQQDIKDFRALIQALEDKVNSSHEFVDKHVLVPGHDVSVKVIEIIGSETIKMKTFSFPGTDVLTLSAGVTLRNS